MPPLDPDHFAGAGKRQDLLQFLNQHSSLEHPEISIEDFRLGHPSALLHPKPINITASVHCKFTVAMLGIKGPANNFFPIKFRCEQTLLCGIFIRKSPKFLYSNCSCVDYRETHTQDGGFLRKQRWISKEQLWNSCEKRSMIQGI